MTSIKYKDGSSWVDIALALYPVGSLYFSYENNSPADQFGGTWTQITNKVIRSANNVDTGGSDTHKLTLNELPTHGHKLRVGWGDDNTTDLGSKTVQIYTGSGGRWTQFDTVLSAIQQKDSDDVSPGTCDAFSIMPAYQNVYVWRRTA